MKTTPNIERRARQMFESSRRGADRFRQWLSIPAQERMGWIEKAITEDRIIKQAVEAVIG